MFRWRTTRTESPPTRATVTCLAQATAVGCPQSYKDDLMRSNRASRRGRTAGPHAPVFGWEDVVPAAMLMNGIKPRRITFGVLVLAAVGLLGERLVPYRGLPPAPPPR